MNTEKWTKEVTPFQNLLDLIGVAFSYVEADRDRKVFRVRPVLLYKKAYKTLQGYRRSAPYWGPWHLRLQSSLFNTRMEVCLVTPGNTPVVKSLKGPVGDLFYLELEDIPVQPGHLKVVATAEIPGTARGIQYKSMHICTGWLNVDPAKTLELSRRPQSPWVNMDGSLLGFLRGQGYFYQAETILPALFTSSSLDLSIRCTPQGFHVYSERDGRYTLYEKLSGSLLERGQGFIRDLSNIPYSPNTQLLQTERSTYILEETLCC